MRKRRGERLLLPMIQWACLCQIWERIHIPRRAKRDMKWSVGFGDVHEPANVASWPGVEVQVTQVRT